MIKITYALYRLPHLSLAEFATRWLDEHGPLMIEHRNALRVAHYVQTPRTEHPLDEVLQGARRGAAPPDGMAELLWESEADFRFAFEDRAARKIQRMLLEDEKRFADHSRAVIWIGEQRDVY